ncbi:hypothetical protein ACL1A8_10540 [Corynebacterium striatum]
MTSSFVSDLRFILRAAGVRRRELIAAIALSTVTLTAARSRSPLAGSSPELGRCRPCWCSLSP